ncbi:MAG TPA: sugar ABC transporter ATP-binding protein [Pseudonocardiaceae bacterium]|nr:sugar ABC transporter ATP-binding protein [Pseudonocardiaceae bacterium]
MTEPAAPLLEVVELAKSFGGAQALAGVTFDVAPGEVHGLLGANGSGKSTLIKILAGYHTPDGGSVAVRGEDVALPLAPGLPRALGLNFVHQDLGLVPSLSVLENFLVDRIATSRRRWSMSWRRERTMMREILARYDLDLDPRMPVGDLRPVDRALLAVVRALDGPGTELRAAHRLVVLDEPTVFLPREEVTRLFQLVRRVADSGSSVLFVSHDLDEVREITDRVTVLRSGRVALTGTTSRLSEDELVEAIVGARVNTAVSYRRPDPAAADHVLRVTGLAAGLVADIDFTARPGEIIGLTGLLGSGYEDVVRAVAGAIDATAGRLRLGEETIELSSWTPRRATAHGVVLVPADRLREGAIADLPVTDNVTMPDLAEYMHGGLLRRGLMTDRARELADTYDVRPRDPRLLFGELSGGNQQKVVLAKWLQHPPQVLLLHEPTQGVDIGARQQIFATVRAAAAGRVVLCASSDHDQLAALCDRVLILRRGRIAAQISGDELTKSRITEECLRGGRERTPS